MVNKVSIPNGYKSILGIRETEILIKELKDFFEKLISRSLNLTRVSAPLLLRRGNGLNDNLNGVERVVHFMPLDLNDASVEVVQSLAKWKRVALRKYGFQVGEGLYTDMNAIRMDETLDNLHSIYVDQWDWEKIINRDQRSLNVLKSEVQKIYSAIRETELYLSEHNPKLQPILPEKIHFITSQELEDLFPTHTSKDREHLISKQYGAVFIMKIGGNLRSGYRHDGRSPDYDDWELNGDIVFWYPLLNRSFEISSMGIRVDKKALMKQLRASNALDRKELEYHQLIIKEELPFTIGGGIGQSRLCMFLLKKAHIGEVQVSVWNDEVINECRSNNITLL